MKQVEFLFNWAIFLATFALICNGAQLNSEQHAKKQQEDQLKLTSSAELEAALWAAQAAQAAPEAHQEESYQRVYDAFRQLTHNVQNVSLGNMRRLVQRMNQLVGASANSKASERAHSTESPTKSPIDQLQQHQIRDQNELRAEQVLVKLEQASKETDPNTLGRLGDDVNRLVDSMNESYLRNIRRVVQRLDRVLVGSASKPAKAIHHINILHQSSNGFQAEDANKVPGFPGWDEFIVAMDRMQKSLAQAVRSTTRLVTSG